VAKGINVPQFATILDISCGVTDVDIDMLLTR
jgi:hypothetical protein